MEYLTNLDISIFRAINDICGWSPALDRVVVHLEVLKGSLFLGIFGVLWYQPGPDQTKRRETLVIMILAVAIALIVNRAISLSVPFRVRPMYGIGANAPSFEWHADLEHWSSFPSDNATYLFAIAAAIWLMSAPWGLLFGLFSAFAAVARVYLGIHYPSDVFVGAVIGVVVSLLVVREPLRRLVGARILAFESRYPACFYGIFFVVLAELGTGFPNSRRIGMAVVHLFIGYHQ